MQRNINKNFLPVGVFDSGLGGLTAVREIKELLPAEDIIYFGDTGRLPYGTRSPETIINYACDDMNFLLTNSVKAVLVACGTVSSTALDILKQRFDVPIIGVVEPASKAACNATKKGKIAVLATSSTISAGAFQNTIKRLNPDCEVFGVGCPMFVPLVENGYLDFDNTVTNIITKEYVSKLKNFSPDVIILGCTHYPLIKDIIKKCANEIIGDVTIIDSGSTSALALKEYLSENHLENKNGGTNSFFVSDRPNDFLSIATRFLGKEVDTVTKIRIEDYLYKEV